VHHRIRRTLVVLSCAVATAFGLTGTAAAARDVAPLWSVGVCSFGGDIEATNLYGDWEIRARTYAFQRSGCGNVKVAVQVLCYYEYPNGGIDTELSNVVSRSGDAGAGQVMALKGGAFDTLVCEGQNVRDGLLFRIAARHWGGPDTTPFPRYYGSGINTR
jgi:hypothetical protein